MTAAIETPKATELKKLDEIIGRLRDGAGRWVKASLDERIAVARAMLEGSIKVAARQVHAACVAKGIPPGTPAEGEEWLGGPYVTVRLLRLTVKALEEIKATGRTRIGKVGRTFDGRESIDVFPGSRLDAVLFAGVRAEVHLEPGASADERGAFYQKPNHDGRVCVVLGAGNVNAIPPTDVVTKLFNEGKVCVLKMNPVNAYVGPFIEEAFKDAIDRGLVAVVYGGAEEGSYLCKHAGVDEIHITGSDKTHDMIVWGPPGPERAERMARNKPLIDKEITSELGNVSPVLIVPGPYTEKELAYQAESVAGAVTNNGSFNCNAAKMLVTPRGWERRDQFLARLQAAAGAAPTRRAYYPGAAQRYQFLTEGQKDVRKVGEAKEGFLPWTFVLGLDPADRQQKAFNTEPFCSIVSEATVGSGTDPVAYLDEAVKFANGQLWGTLSATIIVHPKVLADPKVNEAVEKAIRDLRYGTVAVNVWPATAFAMGTTPWGAYPGSTLTDIQSGRGFVHNSPMLEHIEKCVVRHPITASPKLPYFPTHKTAHVLARRLTHLEKDASWLKLLGVLPAALRG